MTSYPTFNWEGHIAGNDQPRLFLCFHQLSPSATHKAYVMATCDVDVDEAYARVKKAGPALGIWRGVSGELRANDQL